MDNYKVLLDIYNNESDLAKTKGGETLRVVQWYDNPPTIEKRSFYRKSLEEPFKIGKLKGLGLDDLMLLMNKSKEIEEVFGND